MTAIPLHCNVCPKEPDFSDISHLLTHVASKGHLSHYHKAQIRGRQDETIRQKIDRYDQWYEKYQIEKLLSQRMITKESKDTTRRVRPAQDAKATSLKPPKSTKSRKRCNKASTSNQPLSSPVKPEVAIDPQLAHSLLPPFQPQQYLQEPPQASGAVNRGHVPRMVDWQFESPSRTARSSSAPLPDRTNCRGLVHSDQSKPDGESDYFRTFLRSPTKTAYPDPSEHANFALDNLGEKESAPSSKVSRESVMRDSTVPDGHSLSDKDGCTASPILKGVRWPGMSLFDSASLEAQRLRNQKKDSSLLEQMQHNSATIEPMEHIFWPEGSLKKTRLITGNVESSPINEPTPPPKRRKTKAARAVLSELNSNVPKLDLNRGRKRQKAVVNEQVDLHDTSQKALAAMRSSHMVYPENAHMIQETAENSDYRVPLKRAPGGGRRKAFNVFTENGSQEPETPTKHQSKAVKPDEMLSNTLAKEQIRKNEQAPTGRLQRAPMTENRSKPGSISDRSESNDSQVFGLGEERVTQRYFSVTGNQPAQFYDTMPSQMDFGGLAAPALSGSTLNPLNAYLHRHRLHQGYSPIYLSHVARSSESNQLNNIDAHGSRKAHIQNSVEASSISDSRTGV